MVPEEIADILKETFGEAIVETAMGSQHPTVIVAAARWHEIARFLRDDPRFQIDLLRCISGVDRLADEQIEVIYDLVAIGPAESDGLRRADHPIAIKIKVDREGGHLPSVADVWPTADWHEREVFDLLGVTFEGHPDPRRILCPDDWVGHPLRKDYEHPLEYHGIPGTTEFGQMSPRH